MFQKQYSKIIALFALLASVCLFAACADNNEPGGYGSEENNGSVWITESGSHTNPSDDGVNPEPAVYTVTFDPAGGSMETTTVSGVSDGTVFSYAEYLPVREGYRFAGWQIQGESGVADAKKLTVHGDVTFIAVWRFAETDSEKFIFELTEDGKGYLITGLSEGFDVANVVVPGIYLEKPVTGIGDSVFNGKDGILSVDFTACTSLKEIGRGNFSRCGELTSVDFSECSELVSIGNSCFEIAPKLETVVLKGLSALTDIGSGCFRDYRNGDDCALPIKELDFSDCTSLTTIGQGSFWHLSQVRILDFSATKLIGLERQTIRFCPALETVVLPATLRADRIGSEVLTDTDQLKEIRLDMLNLFFCVENGVLYDIGKTILFKIPAKSGITSLVAPETLKEVRANAIQNVETLTSVDFSACKPEEIGYYAFGGCKNAEIKVSFDINGRYEDGTMPELGNDWNKGVKNLIYAPTVLMLEVSGLPAGGKTNQSVLMVNVSATDSAAAIAVTLNGQRIEKENGFYALTFVMGKNTVIVEAVLNGKTVRNEYTLERTETKPTVTTTLTDGMSVGDPLEFDIVAKDAEGNALKADAVTVKIGDSESGAYVPFMGLTVSEQSGTVHVVFMWSEMWLDPGDYVVIVTVTDANKMTVSVTYHITYAE